MADAKHLINNASIILVFCTPTVDPSFVTRTLGLEPTHAVSKGGTDFYIWNNQAFVSNVGKWMLVKSDFEEASSMEERLECWLGWLADKREQLQTLRDAGYEPYLQCGAAAIAENLSVCLGPEMMQTFADLGVTICIDTNERPMWEVPSSAS